MGEKWFKIRAKEVEVAVSVGICLLLSRFFPQFQAVTASITALLMAQTSTGVDWKPGIKRLAATALGGAVAVLVVVVDEWLAIPWLLVPLVIAGMLLTLLSCRAMRLPEFSDRIGGITFILVAMVNSGLDRIPYAGFRLLSTLGGVLVQMAVAFMFSYFTLRKTAQAQREETV